MGKKTLLSAVARGAGKNSSKLEGEFERQLNAARAAAAEERVTDTHVAGGADDAAPRSGGITHFALDAPNVRKVEAVDSRVGDKGWQEWVGEVGVIWKVEEIGAELHFDPFRECGGLIDSEVQLFKGWTAQRVATLIAEVTRARNTIGGHASSRRNVHCAGNGKGTEIHEIPGSFG